MITDSGILSGFCAFLDTLLGFCAFSRLGLTTIYNYTRQLTSPMNHDTRIHSEIILFENSTITT